MTKIPVLDVRVIVAGFVMLTVWPSAQTGSFPVLDTITGRPPLNDDRRDWYSKHLGAMAESALPTGPGETYRFLWLRTFDHPVVVRVTCIEKGCVLTALRTNGQGGYEAGSVVERKTRTMSDAEVRRFREMFGRVQFWRPQPADDRLGLDGARWILEVRRGQDYHLWDVWSPDASGAYAAYRELCLDLIRLSGLAVRQGRIY